MAECPICKADDPRCERVWAYRPGSIFASTGNFKVQRLRTNDDRDTCEDAFHSAALSTTPSSPTPTEAE